MKVYKVVCKSNGRYFSCNKVLRVEYRIGEMTISPSGTYLYAFSTLMSAGVFVAGNRTELIQHEPLVILVCEAHAVNEKPTACYYSENLLAWWNRGHHACAAVEPNTVFCRAVTPLSVIEY